jgi:hypothetical protein
VHAFFADRGGAGGWAVFHRSGDVDSKPLVLRHAQRVDRALHELLGGDQAPLVTAVFASSRLLFIDTVRATTIGDGASPGVLL